MKNHGRYLINDRAFRSMVKTYCISRFGLEADFFKKFVKILLRSAIQHKITRSKIKNRVRSLMTGHSETRLKTSGIARFVLDS